MTELPLMEAAGVPVEPNLPSDTFYLVAALRKYGKHSYWRVQPEQWATQEHAESEARALASCWTGAHIIKVTLPAEKP